MRLLFILFTFYVSHIYTLFLIFLYSYERRSESRCRYCLSKNRIFYHLIALRKFFLSKERTFSTWWKFPDSSRQCLNCSSLINYSWIFLLCLILLNSICFRLSASSSLVNTKLKCFKLIIIHWVIHQAFEILDVCCQFSNWCVESSLLKSVIEELLIFAIVLCCLKWIS